MTKRNGAVLARIAPAMLLLALLFLSSAVVVDAGRKVKAPKAPKAVEDVETYSEPKTAAEVMGSMNTQVRGGRRHNATINYSITRGHRAAIV